MYMYIIVEADYYSPPAYYILNKCSVTFVSDQGHVYNDQDHV